MFVVLVLAVSYLLMCVPLLRFKKGEIVISLDNILVAAFAFLFSILFPFVYGYALWGDTTRDYLVDYIAKYEPLQLCWYYLVSYVFMLCMVLVYRRLSGGRCIADVLNKPQRMTSASQAFMIAAILLWVIGVVSDVLYIWEYGGYATYMEYSDEIRSGASDFDNPFSFLMPFRDCVPLASMFFFSLISRKRPLMLPLFLVAFSHAVLIYISNRGRLGFVLFLIIFPVYFLIHHFRLKVVNRRTLLVCVGGAVVLLLLLVGIGNLLSRNTTNGVFSLLAEETSFFFANFKVILDNDIDFRFFYDLITYPIFLLPSSIWRTFNPNTVSDLMTIMIDGSKKGEGGVYGEAPIDSIGLAYFQLGFLGVIVCAVVWGALIALIFRGAKHIRHLNSSLMVHTYLTVSLVLRSILYCDSYNVVQRMFPFIIFVVLYLFISLLMPSRRRIKL